MSSSDQCDTGHLKTKIHDLLYIKNSYLKSLYQNRKHLRDLFSQDEVSN